MFLLKQLSGVNWFKEVGDGVPQSRIQANFNKLPPLVRKIISKANWVVSTARNAVVVVICSLVAYGFDPTLPDPSAPKGNMTTTFTLTGNLKSGLPSFGLPDFTFNTTTGEQLDFGGMLKDLGSANIIIPIIAILEHVAIAKAFCKHSVAIFGAGMTPLMEDPEFDLF